MKSILALVLATLIPISATAAAAQQAVETDLVQPAGTSDLSEYLWINRLIVVFADSPADPRFAEQIDLLLEEQGELRDRDVVILTDTDPAAKSPLRKKLRPRGFMMVLVDKDGRVALRKPKPWSVREITRSIDKTTVRQREVEERRGQK